MGLIRLAKQLQPDVVVTDVEIPGMGGMEGARHICHELLECPVLCLSVHDQMRQVMQALDAGARSYVLKENSFNELVRGIRCVVSGRLFLSV